MPRVHHHPNEDEPVSETEKPALEDTKPEVKPTTPPKKEEPVVYIGKKFRLKKKILLYAILPAVILILLLVGLYMQGFISFKGKASVKLTVLSEKQTPIDTVQVIFGENTTITDQSGNATMDGLTSGTQTMRLTKTGYYSKEDQVKLKRGLNDLGPIILTSLPISKVDLTLSLLDYVSETAVTTAKISLGDFSPILATDNWQFNQVPIGSYQLKITNDGYNDYTGDIKIDENSKALDKVLLVPSGVIVFESNREKGLRGIYTSKYDGSDQKALVKRLGDYEDYSPVLSPHQTKVSFTTIRDGVKRADSSEYKEALYLVNLDGSSLTKINEDVLSYSALWSNDGGYIGYFTTSTNTVPTKMKIYDVVKHQNAAFDDYDHFSNFVFSVDGSVVAFTAKPKTNPGSNAYVYIANPDGTNVRLVDQPNGWASLIEFTSTGLLHYSYYDSNGNKNVYLEYNIATAEKKEILAPDSTKSTGTLSPDKKLRAYVSTRDGKTNLYVSSPDGTNERKLTDTNYVVSGDLLWSSNNGFVMFNQKTPSETARYLVSTNGTAKAKKIVDVNLQNNGGI